MALKEYKRKRSFRRTPEPPPKVEKKARHRFVVQKHRASKSPEGREEAAGLAAPVL